MVLYAIFDKTGSPLTYDLLKETYSPSRFTELQIWDVQYYQEHSFWFADGQALPPSGFQILPIPEKHHDLFINNP